MTTTRLYYTDAETATFEALVRSCEPAGERFEVVLDRTAFYPTSGGQPFDAGRLGEADVVDVLDRDGEVVHVVTGPLAAGERVRGAIDWPRRLDHMQQHSGQHILSAAFERLEGASTASAHLGESDATIDLDREVSPAEINVAEAEANRVVWEDRPVHVRFVDRDEAARLPLRKAPTRAGVLRLVEIADFDLSACGGTHVARTGMVGVIAVSAWERFKGGSRIGFVCGRRVLAAHRRLRDLVAAAGRQFGVAPAEIPVRIERLQCEARERDRALVLLQAELAGHRAVAWRAAAETVGPFRVVMRGEPSAGAAALKTMAQAVVSEPGLVTVLVGGGTPTPVVVARSADVALDASRLMRAATAALGGRGGGRPDLAQGGLAADPTGVVTFMRRMLAS